MRPWVPLAVVVACLCVFVGNLYHRVEVDHQRGQTQLCTLNKTIVGILLPGRKNPAILADINSIIAQASCPIQLKG
jgi:hypothetical protein